MAACVPLPGGGDKISDEALAPIELGRATRGDVEAALGKPTVIWETERVWVYERGPSGAILWIVPGAYSAAILRTELGDDVVIMRFDTDGRVERLDRRVGPVNPRNYGKFLRSWLAEQGGGKSP